MARNRDRPSAGSRKRPRIHSTHMLSPTWMMLKCRNPEVTRRQGSSATNGPNWAPSAISPP